MSTHTDIAIESYRAFAAGDREAVERIFADDFHFTSPLDNRLDRDGYFRECWPGSGGGDPFDIVAIAEDGDRVFVTYEGGPPERRNRNTEVATFRGDQIIDVEVYFGWLVPHPVPEGTHTDPA